MDFDTFMLAIEQNLSALDITLADIASFVTFDAPAKPTDEQIDRDARECVEGRLISPPPRPSWSGSQ